jgi:hypothetical protein
MEAPRRPPRGSRHSGARQRAPVRAPPFGLTGPRRQHARRSRLRSERRRPSRSRRRAADRPGGARGCRARPAAASRATGTPCRARSGAPSGRSDGGWSLFWLRRWPLWAACSQARPGGDGRTGNHARVAERRPPSSRRANSAVARLSDWRGVPPGEWARTARWPLAFVARALDPGELHELGSASQRLRRS